MTAVTVPPEGMPDTGAMAEHRKRVALPIEFTAAGRDGRGKVKNVSLGGLFVNSDLVPEQGDTVELRATTTSGAPLELTGMVWWTTNDGPETPFDHERGFGLRLLEENEAYRVFVENLR